MKIQTSFIDLTALIPFGRFTEELNRLYADQSLPLCGVHRGPGAGLLAVLQWK